MKLNVIHKRLVLDAVSHYTNRLTSNSNSAKPSASTSTSKFSNSSGCVRVGLRLLYLTLAVCIAFNLCANSASASLPPAASVYYTVVSAGFGNFNFSFHYYEYGNSSNGQCSSVGRYFAPSAVEWIDVRNNAYFIQAEDLWPIPNCKAYQLSTVENSRLLSCATSLLLNLDSANIPFNNLGLTYSVRSQASIHYAANLFYTSANVIPMYSPLDNFLLQAYATANVTTSSTYSVNATIDVYYSADSLGNLIAAGIGATPLRFTISGTRADANNGNRPLNIVYDFMQWSQLDSFDALVAVSPPDNGICSSGGTELPTIPATTALPPSNRTMPLESWNNCTRATFELAASTSSATAAPIQIMQIDSLLWPQSSLDIIVTLADTSAYLTNSAMYYYYNSPPYQFSKGYVWTLNSSNFIPAPTANPFTPFSTDAAISSGLCNYTLLNPTESPIQWGMNAGILDTILANTSILSGAQWIGQQSIRGIMADSWTTNINIKAKFENINYNFALQIYTTASGWINMGRIIGPSMGRQLLRLQYTGINPVDTLQTDFFMQYKWNVSQAVFIPKSYGCNTPAV